MRPENDSRAGGSSIPVEEIEPSEGMFRLFLAGERERALKLAQEILTVRPDDAIAASVVAQCLPASGLEAEMDSVPEILAPISLESSSAIDHRAPFLLSRIDGSCTLEQIVAEAGFDRIEALRILHDLVSQGVIRLRRREG